MARHLFASIASFLLLAVVAEVALGNTVPDSSVETVDPSFEKPVDSSEGVELTSATCSGPMSGVPCIVSVAAYGYDDSNKCGYVKTNGGSAEDVYYPSDITRYRGIVLFELDPTTCSTRNRQRFDTWGSDDDRVQLVETLESASSCTIIVGVSADSAETSNFDFRNSANEFFTKYDMNLGTKVGLEYRDKFVFIMQKGYPKKTLYRRKPRFGDCLKVSIKLGGNTAAEVSFKEE